MRDGWVVFIPRGPRGSLYQGGHNARPLFLCHVELETEDRISFTDDNIHSFLSGKSTHITYKYNQRMSVEVFFQNTVVCPVYKNSNHNTIQV